MWNQVEKYLGPVKTVQAKPQRCSYPRETILKTHPIPKLRADTISSTMNKHEMTKPAIPKVSSMTAHSWPTL
jgi:hypothetical protein